MAKFRKKPVVIEAFKFTGDHNQKEDPEWIVDAIRRGDVSFGYDQDNVLTGMIIKTLEGWMEASIGDFVIQGIKGEIYPCKPDIFEATYEAV